jgi:hypothetical protein
MQVPSVSSSLENGNGCQVFLLLRTQLPSVSSTS